MDLYLNDTYARDPNNYQLLCRSCNSAKRELEKKYRKEEQEKQMGEAASTSEIFELIL